MGKIKPPNGMHRVSIHDGSSVTQSVLRVNLAPGKGKHAKTHIQRVERHNRYKFMRMFRAYMKGYLRSEYLNTLNMK